MLETLVGIRRPQEWIMAVTGNTITAFLDESGKFQDREVICFGGVYSYNEHYEEFARERGRILSLNGLEVLSAKVVLNFKRPLSKKNDREGLEKRIEDLKGFIRCIRKHLLVVSGVTVDVAAFKKQPTHLFEMLGNDPCYAAFAREVLQIIGFCGKEDKISLICDEDEGTAMNFYHLYRRIKLQWPQAKDKFAGITFADDKYLFALQAADLVVSLIRLEAGKRMLQIPYDYEPLFSELNAPASKGENIWQIEISFNDSGTLSKLADDLKKEWDKRKLEKEQD